MWPKICKGNKGPKPKINDQTILLFLSSVLSKNHKPKVFKNGSSITKILYVRIGEANFVMGANNKLKPIKL